MPFCNHFFPRAVVTVRAPPPNKGCTAYVEVEDTVARAGGELALEIFRRLGSCLGVLFAFGGVLDLESCIFRAGWTGVMGVVDVKRQLLKASETSCNFFVSMVCCKIFEIIVTVCGSVFGSLSWIVAGAINTSLGSSIDVKGRGRADEDNPGIWVGAASR